MSIFKALVAASSDIGKAIKDSTNPHYRSGYASLESVIDTIKPALSKQGLAFVQRVLEGDSAKVETLLVHESGETFSLGVCDVPVDKGNAQGYGSALTYARRYGLLTAFGVPSVDDDGNAASTEEKIYKYKIETQLSEKQLAYLKSFAKYDEETKTWYAPRLDAKVEKYLVGAMTKEEYQIKQRAVR